MLRLTLLLIPYLTLVLPAGAQSRFTDITQAAGFDLPSSGFSVAVGDYDNDGWEDLYLGIPDQPNQLWKNRGDGTFVEVGQAAGVALSATADTRTAVWGDFDNDGDLDLYVANRLQPDRLFRNDGDGTFTDVTQAAGIDHLGYPQSANLADIDADGDLDLYLANFDRPSVLYRNNGDGTFTDIAQAAGVRYTGKAMGAIFFDYDRDGDPDLYLVHDNFQPNRLYRNDGTGRFTDVAAAAGANTTSFGMGVDVADLDNDGWLDLYIANLNPNFLLRNTGSGTFTDVSAFAEIGDAGMGWGTNCLDFDNDGRRDIYVTNEYLFSPYPNVLYRNLGELHYAKAETDGPVCNELASYGSATLDFDQDGRVDLAVANRGGGAGFQLFRNGEREGQWIGLHLVGQVSNRQAIGARVRMVDALGTLHYDEITAGSSWLSQSSGRLHFGLGTATAIEELTIYWPSGAVQAVTPPPPGQYYTVFEGQSPVPGIAYAPPTATRDDTPADTGPAVFPNPTPGEFTVRLGAAPPATYHLRVSDALGRTLLHRVLEHRNGGELRVPVALPASVPAGRLWVALTGPRGVATRPVVVKR